jgi:hypothetical protein
LAALLMCGTSSVTFTTALPVLPLLFRKRCCDDPQG